MTRTTHVAIGALTGVLIAMRTEQQPLILGVFGALAVFGALMPDYDLRLGLKHRGITHTLLALALLWLASYAALPYPLAWALPAGYASHLAADMLTPVGVPLFGPLNWNAIRFARVRTGGALDALLGAVTALGAVLLVIWSLVR